MKTLKIISDLLPIPSYTVILICFFFPFITIKCGTTELASVTGFDYVVGTDMKEKMKDNEMIKGMQKKMGKDLFNSDAENEASVDENGNAVPAKEEAISEDTQKDKQNRINMMIMMGIPFLMAIAGLIVSFIKLRRKSVFHIVFSSIGFLIMLSFGIIIKNSDELNSVSTMAEGMGGGMISIGLGGAYYFATVLFLLLIMYFGMEKYLKNLYRKEEEIREESSEDFFTKE